MKKTILLIGIILCIAVIGSVLAVAVYDADDITGSVSTDTYLYLTMNSTEGQSVTLQTGVPTILPIVLGVDSNDSSWGSGKLTITPAAAADKSIAKVTIGIYSDETASTAITENATTDGNGVITLTGITEGQTVYVKLLLAADATQTEVTNTQGTLTCSFVRVSA